MFRYNVSLHLFLVITVDNVNNRTLWTVLQNIQLVANLCQLFSHDLATTSYLVPHDAIPRLQ